MRSFRPILVALLLLAAAAPAAAQTFDDRTVAGLDRGIIVVPSAFSVPETMDRLEQIVRGAGATVFARVDHAANAASVGMQLAPMQLLIYGNPKVGTPAMQADPLTGLDLPLKSLVFLAPDGGVYLAYNDPVWFAQRHGIPTDHQGVQNTAAALAEVARLATQPTQ